VPPRRENPGRELPAQENRPETKRQNTGGMAAKQPMGEGKVSRRWRKGDEGAAHGGRVGKMSGCRRTTRAPKKKPSCRERKSPEKGGAVSAKAPRAQGGNRGICPIVSRGPYIKRNRLGGQAREGKGGRNHWDQDLVRGASQRKREKNGGGKVRHRKWSPEHFV